MSSTKNVRLRPLLFYNSPMNVIPYRYMSFAALATSIREQRPNSARDSIDAPNATANLATRLVSLSLILGEFRRLRERGARRTTVQRRWAVARFSAASKPWGRLAYQTLDRVFQRGSGKLEDWGIPSLTLRSRPRRSSGEAVKHRRYRACR